jgi:hypothetical protein
VSGRASSGGNRILERTVKAAVRKRLKEIGAYQYWVVPFGLSETTLDVIGCYKGAFFGIECKRPGGKLTQRQKFVIENMRAAGALVFVIDNVGDANALFNRVEGDKAAAGPI